MAQRYTPVWAAVLLLTAWASAGGVSAADAAVTAQPTVPPMLARATEQELLASGCQRMLVADRAAVQVAQTQGWRTMVPADATGEALVACPPRVAGAVALAATADPWDPYYSSLRPVRWLQKFFYSRVPGAYEGTKEITADYVAFALKLLFDALGWAAERLLTALLRYVPILLSLSGFLTNKAVTALWPLILGIVNLGFMFVLLFIALVTALHLEIGGGWRRLLPRLLLAAILVNFSLVIAGVILDLSRVFMALLPRLIRGASSVPVKMATLGEDIIKASEVVGLGEVLQSIPVAQRWADVATSLTVAIIRWGLVIAAAIVVFTLLIRYIMLLVLLIISPIAYLAVVFPNTSGLARQWWLAFLRYVIYAPAILFILLALVASQGFFDGLFDLADRYERRWAKMFGTVTVMAFMIAAAMAGKFAGIVGSTAVLGAVASGGRRLRGMAYWGGRGGARLAGRAAGAVVGAAGRVTGVSPFLAQRRRDIERRRREREQRSPGTRLARRLYGETHAQRTEAKQHVQQIRANNTLAGIASIRHEALRNERAGRRLSRDEASQLTINVVGSGDRGKAVTLLSNVEIVRNMNDAAKASVYTTGDAQLIRQLHESERKITEAIGRSGGRP